MTEPADPRFTEAGREPMAVCAACRSVVQDTPEDLAAHLAWHESLGKARRDAQDALAVASAAERKAQRATSRVRRGW